MNVFIYSDFCGPAAFAAIVGCTRNAAAKALIGWSRIAGYPPRLETSPTVMAAALIMRGFRLEKWAPVVGGWRTETAAEFARRIWATIRTHRQQCQDFEESVRTYVAFRDRPRPRAVERALRAADDTFVERARRREPERFTVRQWLARRPVGTWVLHVAGHVMVARAGRIVSGDSEDAEEYGSEALIDAWRVLPRII